LNFSSYNEIDNVPFEVYAMSFYVLKKDADYLYDLIEQLYTDKLPEDYDFYNISLN